MSGSAPWLKKKKRIDVEKLKEKEPANLEYLVELSKPRKKFVKWEEPKARKFIGFNDLPPTKNLEYFENLAKPASKAKKFDFIEAAKKPTFRNYGNLPPPKNHKEIEELAKPRVIHKKWEEPTRKTKFLSMADVKGTPRARVEAYFVHGVSAVSS